MKKGTFIDIGTPDGVITDKNLEKVYNIKVKVVSIDSDVNRKICVPVGDCDPVNDTGI
jgi:ABC-type cobalamin/Fe3+-siderophores transport system ATPase subunit